SSRIWRMCSRPSCARSAVATEVKLPRLGQGMESGTIVRWLKSEGEPVAQGVEAEASGVLLKIAVAEGEVEVGRTIAFIGKEGETVAVEAPAPQPKGPDTETVSDTVPEPKRVSEPTTNGRIKASPLARRLARERGIDLASLRGSGPEGRIVAQDVESPAPAAARPASPVASGEV